MAADINQPLTPKQEAFAQGCVAMVNQVAAYRAVYDCSDANWRTVHTAASKLAHAPHVAARIRQLQDEAAQQSGIPSLAVRIQELREIESADPNDIISLRWVNCRHCHGIDHGYQWTTDAEYAEAYDEALKNNTNPPEMSGGFGFNGTHDPHPDCPRCFGIGVQRPHIADTTKLVGPARRLYKGAKIKGNGDIEILLHDQMQARDQLNRIMGAYKDGFGTAAAPTAAVQEAAEAKTPEERQRGYLRLVSG